MNRKMWVILAMMFFSITVINFYIYYLSSQQINSNTCFTYTPVSIEIREICSIMFWVFNLSSLQLFIVSLIITITLFTLIYWEQGGPHEHRRGKPTGAEVQVVYRKRARPRRR